MTADEKKAIEQLNSVMSSLRRENEQFRADMKTLVTAINDKVEAKHMPISLESNILSAVQSSMDKAIKEALGGYNSPLIKLVQNVVETHSPELRKIITEAFEEVIRTDDFKRAIVSAFSHKVARSIISNNDGLYDKVSNELKQDATFKAKMALAVAAVVEECLTGKKVENDDE